MAADDWRRSKIVVNKAAVRNARWNRRSSRFRVATFRVVEDAAPPFSVRHSLSSDNQDETVGGGCDLTSRGSGTGLILSFVAAILFHLGGLEPLPAPGPGLTDAFGRPGSLSRAVTFRSHSSVAQFRSLPEPPVPPHRAKSLRKFSRRCGSY